MIFCILFVSRIRHYSLHYAYRKLLFDAHLNLYSNIFQASESKKCQIKVNAPVQRRI